MKRIGTILMAIAVVGALAAVPLGTAAAIGDDSTGVNADADADANESVTPGEQLAGVVGVQSAEIDGEMSERTYGVQVANAQTDEEKADVVGDRLDEVEERLEEHEATLDELEEAREAGEISEGEYRAKVATVTAEKANTEQALEQAQETTGEVPEDVLEDRNINTEAIQELQDRANELGGQETAEIAQSIAGDSVGTPIVEDRSPGAPDGVGPDSDADTDNDDNDEPYEEDDDPAGDSGEGQGY